MNEEMTVTASTESAVIIEPKKSSRGKKPAGGTSAKKEQTAAPAEEADAVPEEVTPAEITTEKVVETTVPKQKKQFDMHDLISVRNMTPGGLIYKSNRNVGYIVEWAEYNDEQPIEIMELKNMLASQRTFFERNWIWIDDPELLEYLGAAKYYKNMLSPDAVDELFDFEPDEMVSRIKLLTKDMQNTIRVVAYNKVRDGEINSYPTIQALQKYFNISFDDEEE